jgi:hypothetical protein
VEVILEVSADPRLGPAPSLLFPREIRCTDKKVNQIFLIYKEIQNGAVAKSYMTNGLIIYGEIFAHFLMLGSPSSYMTLQLLHSEFPYI